MTDVRPSDAQAKGIKLFIAWYLRCKEEMERGEPLSQPIFRIFGYAGTGKTTTLKTAIAELMEKLKGQYMNIMYGAFTGKAALVMTRKGTPATTIHSMCYKFMEATKEAIEKAKDELADVVAKGPESDASRFLWQAMCAEMRETINKMYKPQFMLNPESAVSAADLIVLDEVSMVGEEMAADLMTFGRPILVLGDPGQLPPIKGEGAFTQAVPDVMLTEIHRQALDSPIIQLATLAREGRPIPFKEYSDDVMKLRRGTLSPRDMLGADQVLCGMNATRRSLSNGMRRAQGFNTVLPASPDEKIICLKNQNDIGLVNGMFLSLSDCGEADEWGFRAKVKTEDGADLGERTIYRGEFDDHVDFDKDRAKRDHFKKKGKVEATYGSAITVHKSQGSQWGNVILFDDGFGRGDDRNKWLYTAITRAESGLLILA